ncbi:MAG: hypothetical protein GWO22_29495, partial [Actinobacteria bacterium]|nr:hypothetical protein [Actinomycetota bacterium]
MFGERRGIHVGRHRQIDNRHVVAFEFDRHAGRFDRPPHGVSLPALYQLQEHRHAKSPIAEVLDPSDG